MTGTKRRRATGICAVAALMMSASAFGQGVTGSMSLVLEREGGQRSSSLLPLGGTIVLTRSEPGIVGNTEDREAPDKINLAFDVSMAANPQLLRWLSGSGDSSAELTVSHGGSSTVYKLTGIVSRNMTLTQSQDGTGQASLVLGARHATVNGVVVN